MTINPCRLFQSSGQGSAQRNVYAPGTSVGRSRSTRPLAATTSWRRKPGTVKPNSSEPPRTSRRTRCAAGTRITGADDIQSATERTGRTEEDADDARAGADREEGVDRERADDAELTWERKTKASSNGKTPPCKLSPPATQAVRSVAHKTAMRGRFTMPIYIIESDDSEESDMADEESSIIASTDEEDSSIIASEEASIMEALDMASASMSVSVTEPVVLLQAARTVAKDRAAKRETFFMEKGGKKRDQMVREARAHGQRKNSSQARLCRL